MYIYLKLNKTIIIINKNFCNKIIVIINIIIIIIITGVICLDLIIF